MVTKQIAQIILTFFAILVCVDCFLVYFEFDSYRFFTKPLLMPTLLVYLLYNTKQTKHKASKMIVFFALLFSWLGDVSLMKSGSDSFFIIGLCLFLVAHIFYIIFFIRLMPFKQKSALLILITSLVITVFMSTFIGFIQDKLGNLQWPVIIYACVISTMLLAAVNTVSSNKLGKISSRFFIPGAIFFVISDSLLALNKFYLHAIKIDLLVMLTYALAQLLIVFGASKFIKKSRAKKLGIDEN